MDYTAQNTAVSKGIDEGLTPMEAYNKYQSSLPKDTTTTPTTTPATTTAPTTGVPGVTQDQIDAARKAQYAVTDPDTAAADYTKAALSSAQSRIDEINKRYADQLNTELNQQAPVNANSLGRTNALSSLMGLFGSSSADTRANITEQANARINQSIISKVNAQKAQELNAIYDKIDNQAFEIQKAQLQTNKENQKALLDAAAKSALSSIQNLASTSGNVDYDTMMNINKDDASFQTILKSAKDAGYTDYDIRETYNKAIPDEYKPVVGEWQDSKGADGTLTKTRSTFDPVQRKTKIETYSTGIPYEEAVKGSYQELKNGGSIMVYPDGSYKNVKLQTPEELAAQKLSLAKIQADINQSNASAAASWASAQKTKNEITPVGTGDIKGTTAQLELVTNSLEKAKKLSGASGRSGARKAAESWFVGSTDYTNLVAETNTLRTNVLTLMTDPNIKKFFGPQMSNADVQLMTSAGTTLNPELQSPENMKNELIRLEDLISRAKNAVNQGKNNTQSTNKDPLGIR